MAESRPISKGRVAILLLVACIGVSGVTWWITWMAARSAITKAVGLPPPAAPVVATVTVGPLETTRTLAGKISLGKDIPLPVGPSTAELPIVTKLAVKTGDVIQGGSCPIAVAGRPLTALSMPFPLYRTLSPGMSGPDVDALLGALADLGKANRPVPGALTAEAIAAFDSICGAEAAAQIAPADVIALPSPAAKVSGIRVALGDKWTDSGITVRIDRPVVIVSTNEPAVLGNLDKATFTDGPLSGQPAQTAGTQLDQQTDKKATEVLFAIPEKALNGLTDGGSQPVTVVTAATDKDVLVVPGAALWTSTAGASQVKVATTNPGEFRDVAVTVLAQQGGSIAIKQTSEVRVGDSVLVGYQQ